MLGYTFRDILSQEIQLKIFDVVRRNCKLLLLGLKRYITINSSFEKIALGFISPRN